MVDPAIVEMGYASPAPRTTQLLSRKPYRACQRACSQGCPDRVVVQKALHKNAISFSATRPQCYRGRAEDFRIQIHIPVWEVDPPARNKAGADVVPHLTRVRGVKEFRN